jgi:hypothetical protein
VLRHVIHRQDPHVRHVNFRGIIGNLESVWKPWNYKLSYIVCNIHVIDDRLFSPPMLWQFWFGICCCLPTPNCKCKGKNMVIPNGLAFWT